MIKKKHPDSYTLTDLNTLKDFNSCITGKLANKYMGIIK